MIVSDIQPGPQQLVDGVDAPPWLISLERAQALVHQAARGLQRAEPSNTDLTIAARSIESALGALFDAIDLRTDRLTAIHAAQGELDGAVAAVQELPDEVGVPDLSIPLREAREALSVAEQRFSRLPPEALPIPSDIRASVDTPALHALSRPSLVPILQVPQPIPSPDLEEFPPIPQPKTKEDFDKLVDEVTRRAALRRKARDEAASNQLDSEPQLDGVSAHDEENEAPEGFVAGKLATLSVADFIATRTRDCFEEVAMLGMQRAPLLGDPWRSAKVLEDRMLAAIDAIVALGPLAISRIEPLVLDAPAKDPSRAFGIGMVLGCIDGRDTLAAAERTLWHLGIHDLAMATSFAAAMKLVPHPALPLAMRTLLSDADPACRAIAMDVLAYRGLCMHAELVAAASDASPLLAARALPALGILNAPELADVVHGATAVEQPDLCEATWLAMVLGNHPRTANVLRTALSGPLADRAALWLAIAGDDRDANMLVDCVRTTSTPGLVTAIGWAGVPDVVPLLIELLDHKDPATQVAAAYALDRLTGAHLVEEVEVEPEAILVPDVEEPEVDQAKPLARMVSEPRDAPGEGANDTVTRPTLRADLWHAYWAERMPDIRSGARYRRGLPYTPNVSLWELDAWPLTPGERRMLQVELVVRTGHFVRFDPHDFVVVQEQALQQWKPVAQRSSSAAGSWIRPMRHSPV